jgi:hypothetical protein
VRNLLATIAGCVVALLSLPAPAPAPAATARRAIAELNAQRAANGIPAGIAVKPGWSRDCAAHDRYMALNHVLGSAELRSNPGYSASGAFAAANSVVIRGASWSGADPYQNAPLHLDQLLAPRLRLAGSADVAGYSCTTTFPGWTRAAPLEPTVYTYPGDGTTTPANETARETPFTPGDLVGIGQPALTGPYLIVFADAPGASPLNDPAALSDATLVGPTGPVAVMSVDGYTPLPSGSPTELYRYISPGGFIIPVAPLAPGAGYHAHVQITFAGQQLSHDWSFNAAAVSPASRLTVAGTELSFRSSSPASLALSFARRGGSRATPASLAPGGHLSAGLSQGFWQACGRQPASAGFGAFTQCVSIVVARAPVLSLGAADAKHSSVSFPLRFGAALDGRRARLTVIVLSSRCGPRGCRTIAGLPRIRTISLDTGSLRFSLPGSRRGLRISLRTPAFTLNGVPWAAAGTERSFLGP